MKYKNIFYMLTFVLVAQLITVPAFAEEEDKDIRRITKEEAKTLINNEDITIIDVRYTKNWNKSEQKIAGAVRENPNELGSWTGKYPKDHKIILYCD